VTFDRHPNHIVAPARVPPLLQSLPQRLRAIEALGADTALLLAFDEALSRVPGAEFIRGLARDFGRLHSVCVGSDFHFGHKRSGNVDVLRQLGAELRFQVHGLAAVSLDGQAVSSTRIREAIRAGRLDDAGQMLGRPWALAGRVVAGARRGRSLGFPTANLDTAGLVLPPDGVYAAHAQAAGRTHRAVVNLGLRPTVAAAGAARLVEAHLLDFSGDLYGVELELTFAAKLREERKFSSVETLREQIVRDVAEARRLFGE
jgi:riboflavin kinase/FMN adenylyltransferase